MLNHTSLSIDAGQTGIRALLEIGRDGAGAAGDSHSRSFDFPGIRTDIALIPQLASVVAGVAEAVASDSPATIDIVAAGVSGLTTEESKPEQLLVDCRDFGVSEVYLAHDSVTSYLGALGDDRGVVVASGTGVVTLAVGASAVARIDGWGNLIGDAGSGYWIGRAALDAVMRAHDGRGATTRLTDVIRRDFPDLEHAYIDLQGDASRVSRIAAYASSVTELAPRDAVARAICDAAAAELVLSAATGLRVVGEGALLSPAVCAIGGVLRSPEIRMPFEAGLRALWPGVDLRPAASNALGGASLLPHLAAHSALRERVTASNSFALSRPSAG